MKKLLLLLSLLLVSGSVNALTLNGICQSQVNGACNATTTDSNNFWFNVDLVSGETVNISITNTTSGLVDGLLIFDEYEDFLSVTLNTSKLEYLQVANGVNISGGLANINYVSGTILYGLRTVKNYTASNETIAEWRSNTSFTPVVNYQGWYENLTYTRRDTTPRIGMSYGVVVNRVHTRITSDVVTAVSSIDDLFMNWSITTPSNVNATFVRNNTFLATHTTQIPDYDNMSLTFGVQGDEVIELDWLRIRKYTSNPPVITLYKTNGDSWKIQIDNSAGGDIDSFELEINGLNLTNGINISTIDYNLTTDYDTVIHELNSTNYTINVDLVNSTGGLKTITVTNLTINGTTYSEFNSTLGNVTNYNITRVVDYGIATGINNTLYVHTWTLLVEWKNGTDQLITTGVNNQTLNWKVYFSNVSTLDTLEGQSFFINSTVTDDTSGLVTIVVNHSWNNTNYTTLGTYWNQLTAPFVSANTNVYYNGWMSVTYLNTTITRNSTNKTQVIQNFVIPSSCGGVNVTINFTFRDEFTEDVNLSAVNVFINLTDLNSTAGVTSDDITYIEICTNLFNTSVKASVEVQYFYDDYATRYYYLLNTTLHNITRTINLYTITSATSSEIPYTLKILGGASANRALICADKNPFLNATYKRVDCGITGSDGKVSLNLELNQVYRHSVVHKNISYDLGQREINTLDITQGIEFNLDSGIALTFLDDDLTIGYTNLSSNNITSVQILTTNSEEITVNLLVTRSENYLTTTICDVKDTSNSMTLSCYIGNQTGLITVQVIQKITSGDRSILTDYMQFTSNLSLGIGVVFGLFYFIVTISLLLIGVSVMLMILPIVMIWLLQLTSIITLSPLVIWGLTFVSVVSIIIIEGKK